jgi:hypothetical protein
VSERPRKLGTPWERSRPAPKLAFCPITGLTIPECSCQRCVEELIRTHSPVLLDRRFGKRRRPAA